MIIFLNAYITVLGFVLLLASVLSIIITLLLKAIFKDRLQLYWYVIISILLIVTLFVIILIYSNVNFK